MYFFAGEDDGDLMKKIRRFMDCTNKSANIIAAISLLMCVSSAIVNVIARYLFNRPFKWSEEFCVITLVWMVYCSLPHLEQNNENLNMTAFYNYLPRKVKEFVNILCSLTVVAISVVIVKASIAIVVRNYAMKINTQVFDWPYWIIYLVIPLSFALFIPTCLANLKKQYKADAAKVSSTNEKYSVS
jgi:C4-dicarboxylate transporter DctQ subunit